MKHAAPKNHGEKAGPDNAAADAEAEPAAARSRGGHAPLPRVTKQRWPVLLIWLVPLAALVGAGFYLYDYLQNRGTEIVIHFADGAGLKAGQTFISHRGVQVGLVDEVNLSSDQKQVLVHVRLMRTDDVFAKQGSLFWVVRPEVSIENVSGLGTLASGPYIEAVPGAGAKTTEFTGLEHAPPALGPGITLKLHALRVERLQSDTPVYYHGFQVGVVQGISLSPDATGVIVQVFIRRQYQDLVRRQSVFWIVSGIDVKGGLLSGVQLKLESLRAVLSGGIAFATPEKLPGFPVSDGDEFPLHDDSKPEWLTWSPKIAIPQQDSGDAESTPAFPANSGPGTMPTLLKAAHDAEAKH